MRRGPARQRRSGAGGFAIRVSRLAHLAARAPGWQIVLAATVLAVLAEAARYSNAYYRQGDILSQIDGLITVATAAAFVAAGLMARRRQPDNPTGALLALVGFALLAEDIRLVDPDASLIYTVGAPLAAISTPALIWLVLAFPSGRVAAGRDRVLLAAFAVATTFVASPRAGLVEPQHARPRSLLRLADVSPGLNRVLDVVTPVLLSALVACLIVVVLNRWRRSSRPARRVLTPFLVASAAIGVTYAGWQLVPDHSTFDPVLQEAAKGFGLILPFAFLLGVVRLELARVDVVQAVLGLGPQPRIADLRATASRALGDPLLRILRREPDGTLVDESEQPAAAPPDATAAERLVRAGRTLGVLVHDPALRQDGKLFEAVTGVITEALERDRLALESRRNRERVEAIAEEERRRMERDLHDGAQQRIAAVAMWLDVLEARLGYENEGDAGEVIDRISRELDGAIDELRRLTHGRLPAVLIDEGLEAALRELAERTPQPVTVRGNLDGPVPPAVSAAAYFAVAEGLTNAIRHSGANAIEVELERRNGELKLRVRDNGRGGADLAAGTGLRGLAGRLEAHGGRLEVISPQGGGTLLELALPAHDVGDSTDDGNGEPT